MFSLRKIFFTLCLVVSALCLAVGYVIVGEVIGAVIAIIAGLAWLLARNYVDTGLPFICLMGSVCLAVIGRLMGAPSLLMICGSGFALAVWDIIFLDNALGNNSLGEQTRQYEIKHLQSLGLVLGFGFLVAFFGRLINLQIPFMAIILFVALVVFGLDRAYGYIKKRKVSVGNK